MILFLTSSPSGAPDGSEQIDGLDERNGFVEKIRSVWPDHARVLMISAFPQDYAAGDQMRAFFADACRGKGLFFDTFDLWDGRTEDSYQLDRYDVVWLGGGHVPTENSYFRQIHLKEKLRHFDGIVIGISAGTMNCAESVYALPELAGEGADPMYQRFLPGLGLTRLNVIPHFQMLRDFMLDHLRVVDDIACNDSRGQAFLALCDGSYVLAAEGTETVYGKAYRIRDGRIELFCMPEATRPASEL